MRFYSTQHRYYCGIDLHARTMYVCILDQGGAATLRGTSIRKSSQDTRPSDVYARIQSGKQGKIRPQEKFVP
jgi:hypothetical protein